MKELLASADEVYKKCAEALDTHLNWLHDLKDRPEYRGARLGRIIDACKLTEHLHAACGIVREALDARHARFVSRCMDAYCPSGEPFHETCCEYGYKGRQRWADRIWKLLNVYKAMYLNSEKMR